MRELNDNVDFDVQCYSVINVNLAKNHRAPECTGVITAGEPHNRWVNAWIGIDGLTREDPRNAIRFCRHCVRHANWEQLQREEWPLLTKVELTYHDGSKRVLEGEAALAWKEMAGAQATMSFVHGMQHKPLPWIEIPPPAENKP